MLPRVRTERPENFQVDLGSQLARGAVFLGLGQAHHTARYRDESAYGTHGVLTTMDPLTDWGWDTTLGRWVLDFDGASDHIPIPVTGLDSITIACWVKTANVSAHRPFVTCTKNAPKWGLLFRIDGGTVIQWHVETSTAGEASCDAPHPGANLWFHACGTHVPGRQELYVDGALVDTDNRAGNVAYAHPNLQIGREEDYARYMYGRLADVCIWDRALSLPEVAALADPSNVMLRCGGSSLIAEPRPRRGVVGQVGAPPAGNRRRRLLICGAA